MIYFFKVFFKELFLNIYAKMLGYYTSVDKIPIYNWDKIENGHYEYLYKHKIGHVPEYFKKVISDMFFQFETVNSDLIQKRLDLAYLRSLYVTSKRIDFYNKARFLAAEIERMTEKEVKKSTLNEKINFVETTFNSIGSIDKHKVDAQRFYSMLNLAIKKIDNIRAKSHGNN